MEENHHRCNLPVRTTRWKLAHVGTIGFGNIKVKAKRNYTGLQQRSESSPQLHVCWQRKTRHFPLAYLFVFVADHVDADLFLSGMTRRYTRGQFLLPRCATALLHARAHVGLEHQFEVVLQNAHVSAALKLTTRLLLWASVVPSAPENLRLATWTRATDSAAATADRPSKTPRWQSHRSLLLPLTKHSDSRQALLRHFAKQRCLTGIGFGIGNAFVLIHVHQEILKSKVLTWESRSSMQRQSRIAAVTAQITLFEIAQQRSIDRRELRNDVRDKVVQREACCVVGRVAWAINNARNTTNIPLRSTSIMSQSDLKSKISSRS